MKIKTRLAIAFITITVVPIALIYISVIGLTSYQGRTFQKTYGLSEQIDLLSSNSTQIFNRMTQSVQKAIEKAVREDPERFEDMEYLDGINAELEKKYSYAILRREDAIAYSGSPEGKILFEILPPYGEYDNKNSGGFYLDGEEQHLIKQIDFEYADQTPGSFFIITNVGDYVPEMKSMLVEMLCSLLHLVEGLQYGTEIWTLRWMWTVMTRSACCVRTLRKCASDLRNRQMRRFSTIRRARSLSVIFPMTLRHLLQRLRDM